MQEIINGVETLELILDPETQLVTVDDSSPTISVLWDRAAQQAVINTALGPTIGSRAYGMVHTAMFDAWAAYDPVAIATQLGDDLQRPESEITEANKIEAMSYAAYRVLADLFPSEVEIFDDLMADLDFDPNNTTTDTATAAGIGNVSAAELLDFRRVDGSNQLGDDPRGNGEPYSDISGYQPVNSADQRVDIERWTPERVPINAEPGEEDRIQQFLTPQWGDVTPFALDSGDQFQPPEPESFLLVDGEVDLEAKTITLADGSVVEISKDLIGTIINPDFIEQAEEIVDVSANLTDEQKMVAEFWEDGGGTSFPPGTWMTFGQFVSAREDNTLDEDAQLFFALGNAVFDAGIATWEAKRFYDYVRPVRAIRDLGELGLIGEFDESRNGYVIDAWAGPGLGTQTILATDFLTYQTPGSDPSPPFAEYTSGHSAFSASAAEILKLFTGSDQFGASVTFESGSSRFEPDVTPEDPVTLEWETFSEASDEAGISRIYGGIHFENGDINGRTLGRQVGAAVFDQAQFFINGGIETRELVLGSSGDDWLDAADPSDNFDGNNDTVFTGSGNDLIDASQGVGLNRIDAGSDDDTLIAGTNNRMLGGPGEDWFFVGTGGGGNLITGGTEADQFWIITDEKELPPVANTITDFNLDEEDVIGFANTSLTFESRGIDWDARQEGANTVIEVFDQKVAVLLEIQASSLSEANFVFA